MCDRNPIHVWNSLRIRLEKILTGIWILKLSHYFFPPAGYSQGSFKNSPIVMGYISSWAVFTISSMGIVWPLLFSLGVSENLKSSKKKLYGKNNYIGHEKQRSMVGGLSDVKKLELWLGFTSDQSGPSLNLFEGEWSIVKQGGPWCTCGGTLRLQETI